MVTNSETKLGYFWEMLAINVPSKVAQILGDFC